MLTLRVNGTIHKLEVDPSTPLLWVLREQLGLTGTKFSCGIGECGACTVLAEGKPTLSCVATAGDFLDKDIVTIEGLKGPLADVLRRAWIIEDVVQCGYCQSGQLLVAYALLASNPHPTDADINAAMSGVLCRCGTYNGIRRAIHHAGRRT